MSDDFYVVYNDLLQPQAFFRELRNADAWLASMIEKNPAYEVSYVERETFQYD